MSRRLKLLERRLARVAAFFRDRAAETEETSRLYEARGLIASLTRDAIARAGLDPDASRALRCLATPEPPPPPAVRRPAPRDAFLAEISRLVERMRGDPPDLATASPLALFAYYCFGAGAKPAPP